ncbi:malonic semialdehyde reductase [Parahaliea mediterranea]|uniref:malonic semialdehyde reductase n=1 Tax=Parahaliea mediterranea TaxID=651086 RepID=UPI000E2E8AC4|nr:malonic semialdehyde reductase [Parahaliea mediterranea]
MRTDSLDKTPDNLQDNLQDNPLASPAARAAQARAAALQAASRRLDDPALDQLFRQARSHNGWQDKPVPGALLEELYRLSSWGPTSMNCSPARFVFVRSQAARDKLLPALAPANVDKVSAAPVTAIIAQDERFYEQLPRLFPHRDAAPLFRNNAALAQATAFRNATLQGAYLMMAARALGLDCGPLSGFDNAAVDAAFFSGTAYHSNFLCCLGYGQTEQLFQRLPRLDFNSACQVL